MEGKTSSVVQEYVEPVQDKQSSLPTWGILIVLIIAMVVLKSFIYIKDDKRHGK